jgi:hypothetical protein
VSGRVERRAAVRDLRQRSKLWSEKLVEVPREQWPGRPGLTVPVKLWKSRHYLAQLHEETWLGNTEVLRLSVNRVARAAGGWGENIPWQELMRCKREAGYADWYAIEIYPRDRDIVNVANMRHLWLLSEPLAIGWFDGQGEAGI